MVIENYKFQSLSLSKMIYSSNWIYASSETKKLLLILLMRTQRPFQITANGYVVMDLNTYGKVRFHIMISTTFDAVSGCFEELTNRLVFIYFLVVLYV